MSAAAVTEAVPTAAAPTMPRPPGWVDPTIDRTFRARKAALRDQTIAQATAIWNASYENRNQYLGRVLTLVEGAQRAVATLTSGYLTLKARQLEAGAPHKSLKLGEYTVAKLRGESGPDVYGAVYGALYGQMLEGASEADAHAAAVAALSKLVSTDVQMAYTAAASDWMDGDPHLAGFQRVPSGTCDYCESAAQGSYDGDVRMPVHENCECDVQPITSRSPLPSHSSAADGIASDIGQRIVTDGLVPSIPEMAEADAASLVDYAEQMEQYYQVAADLTLAEREQMASAWEQMREALERTGPLKKDGAFAHTKGIFDADGSLKGAYSYTTEKGSSRIYLDHVGSAVPGTGTQMLKDLARTAIRAGATNIDLQADTETNVGFYTKLGFRLVSDETGEMTISGDELKALAAASSG